MAYIDTKYLGKCETCRHHSNSGCNTYCDHGEEYSPSLSKIPTADVVEVKHGEWKVNVGMNFNKERICPICGEGIEGNHWNFCSNCGAKMDGTPKERGGEK